MLHRAARMRREPTEPERRMWMALRDRRFFGFKFRRQAVMASRIVDFFCPAKALVVEIDGHTHDPVEDSRRDRALLEQYGFHTLRFTNLEVMENLEGAMVALKLKLDALPDRWVGRDPTTPRPPPLKRRGSDGQAPSSSEEGVGGGGREHQP